MLCVCWEDVRNLEPPRNLILAVTIVYHCVLQRGTYFSSLPSAPSWRTSHSIYIFLAFCLIFSFLIVCVSSVWSCDSVGPSCDMCKLCLVILCVSCGSVGQSCDMYKFCLVICFSVIVLCYVGARDHVSQCVGHVLCGSSLWSVIFMFFWCALFFVVMCFVCAVM